MRKANRKLFFFTVMILIAFIFAGILLLDGVRTKGKADTHPGEFSKCAEDDNIITLLEKMKKQTNDLTLWNSKAKIVEFINALNAFQGGIHEGVFDPLKKETLKLIEAELEEKSKDLEKSKVDELKACKNVLNTFISFNKKRILDKPSCPPAVEKTSCTADVLNNLYEKITALLNAIGIDPEFIKLDTRVQQKVTLPLGELREYIVSIKETVYNRPGQKATAAEIASLKKAYNNFDTERIRASIFLGTSATDILFDLQKIMLYNCR